MKTIFRYPGAKTRLLKTLDPFLGEIIKRGKFVDLFVGGGSVSLHVASKYPKLKLWINDIDPLMHAFWTVVIVAHEKSFQKLVRRVRRTIPTLDLFYKLRSLPASDILDMAFRAVFFNRTTFSGILDAGPIGGKEQKSQWKVDCRYNAPKLVEGIKSIRKLLHKRTRVTQLDFRKVLNKIKGGVYLDPPYRKKGKECYTHSFEESDHCDLAEILKQKKRWLLSYDTHNEIMKMYEGWSRIMTIDASYSISGTNRKSWVNAKELLITSK